MPSFVCRTALSEFSERRRTRRAQMQRLGSAVDEQVYDLEFRQIAAGKHKKIAKYKPSF